MTEKTIILQLSNNNTNVDKQDFSPEHVETKIFSTEEKLFECLNKIALNQGEYNFQNIILIKDAESVNFSLRYLISTTDENIATAVCYQKNVGQKLISINDDYSINDLKKLSLEDFEDGFEETGVYLVKKAEEYNDILNIKSFQDLFQLTSRQGQAIPVVEYSYNSCAETTPAIFLDRDGIINVDINYLHMAEDFELFSGVIEVISYANKKGWPVFVVTNQSGVGRMRFTDKHVTDLHEYIDGVFEDNNVHVNDWIHCSFHGEKAKDPKYKKQSLLRKPHPGMLLEVAKGYNVDISKSFMIGDKVSDEILLPGLKNLHMKRQYDLTEAKAPVFEKYEDLLDYIKKNS